jgi:2-dehydropantoate 2-reductase
VLRAAGIAYASAAEDAARRGDLLRIGEVPGVSRAGGSTWQSLARGAGAVEADYLNGEIVLLGRLHGVPTPANETARRLVNRHARDGARPGTLTPEQFLAAIG